MGSGKVQENMLGCFIEGVLVCGLTGQKLHPPIPSTHTEYSLSDFRKSGHSESHILFDLSFAVLFAL